MLKADRAKKIISILNKIYPETPIPLNHKNNFELLISVLLSAQCTDKRVNEVTPLLFKKANNPAKMEKLPVKTFEDLEALPGVGHKTASVVMSQGFGHPAFPVDTHIHRLAQRWGLTNGKSVKQTEHDLKKIFPEKLWNKLHLQIIFYGREYCEARSCFGIECKICKTCYPNRKKPIKTNKA